MLTLIRTRITVEKEDDRNDEFMAILSSLRLRRSPIPPLN